jgi:hypothetical protein
LSVDEDEATLFPPIAAEDERKVVWKSLMMCCLIAGCAGDIGETQDEAVLETQR